MSRKKSLLLLGSTGFLGSAILSRLKNEHLQDWEILISQSTAPENPLLYALLGLNQRTKSKFNSTNLFCLENSDLVVINCASSRNSKNEELSRQSNYEFPAQVLESLLSVEGLRIHWIQIETFWQYSRATVPDQRYIFWKNRLGALLSKSSSEGKLTIKKLALPHLIGPFDDSKRLLPRTFLKLLNNEEVTVESPEQVFYLADVRDVANHLVRTITQADIRLSSESALFPSHEIQLGEIIDRFLKNHGSRSTVRSEIGGENTSPKLIPEDQPPLLKSNQQLLRSLDSTFADIVQWLSGFQRIDNLQ